MIKLTQNQLIKSRLQKLENEKIKEFESNKFPCCTKLFPECHTITINNLSNNCNNKCPYWDGERYKMEKKKLNEEEYKQHLEERGIVDIKKIFEVTQENNSIILEKEVKSKSEKTVRDKSKKNVINIIRELFNLGVRDRQEMFEKVKLQITDRDDEYLLMRIKYSIPYLEKEKLK
jgi:hypothetical protein